MRVQAGSAVRKRLRPTRGRTGRKWPWPGPDQTAARGAVKHSEEGSGWSGHSSPGGCSSQHSDNVPSSSACSSPGMW